MKTKSKSDDKLEPSIPFVYVPGGAKINEETSPLPPPDVQYDKRNYRKTSRSNFRRENLGKIVGGKYGKECSENKD